MESKRLSKIDKAFLVVIAGVFVLGVLVQAGYSFSGEENTFGIDPTGEGYIEVHDVNISRDWFRGLVNVTDTILGIYYNLIPDAPDTYDLGSTSAEWNDIYLGTGRLYFWTDQQEYIYSDGTDTLVFGAGGASLVAVEIGEFRPLGADGTDLGTASNEWNDIYIGTGRAYFWTDQGEAISSNSGGLVLTVNNVDQIVLQTDTLKPLDVRADAIDLGTVNAEWQDLFVGSGRIWLYTDQAESLSSSGGGIVFRVGGVDQLILTTGTLKPFNARADAIDLGTTDAEYQDLYLGTGRLYLWTDQGESIYSDGSSLIFSNAGTIRWYINQNGHLLPFSTYDIGSTSAEVRSMYLGTGKMYFWTDQGESIGSDGNNLLIDGSNGVLSLGGNNTGAIGSDAVRWASGWFTTMTAKSLVTGKVIEKELKPFPGESFEEGDVVKIYDSNYFVKSNKVLDYVVGVVVNNPEQIIVDYNVSWEMVSSEIPVTHEVEYVLNKTDAYGNRFEVIESRTEYVYEYYLNPVEENLLDGSTVTVYYNESRIVYQKVWENVTTENPIFGEKGDPVLCVAGKARVKISEPVLKNDILVAGPNGEARSLRSAIQLLKNQYSGKNLNWNNLFTVIEGLNLRTLGQVMEDSTGSYCWVVLW